LSRGVLLIAEVKSRFDTANGGADSADFVKALKGLGFSLISQVSSLLSLEGLSLLTQPKI
jgi:hypothetical protein